MGIKYNESINLHYLQSYQSLANKKAEKMVKDPDRLKKFTERVLSKLGKLTGQSENIQQVQGVIRSMVKMLKAYASGEYRVVPLRSIIAISGSLIYFVTPVDLIPDFIPISGLFDDLTLLLMVYKNIRNDIQAFELWSLSQ
ncbi:YkvA family protein [Xanthovirga aplysinae]|uniref:YkvA family protein n=1 Tax=Xanthovirga aplysinae TaxID=2529853 RepID=UPI0012BC74B5|nr:YkvA family protein [Xanthovirga aplysinae]MTI33370.1 DUF1232 domain-containing protein [Xanthovirga aplysinae]